MGAGNRTLQNTCIIMVMNEPNSSLELRGRQAVIDWFGEWPSFHDAEVISLLLARRGPSIIRIYPYAPDKPATVDFVLEDVTDLELADFSPQNVLFGLSVEMTNDKNGDRVCRVLLHDIYGIGGRIDAKSLHVTLVPGKSPDEGSNW